MLSVLLLFAQILFPFHTFVPAGGGGITIVNHACAATANTNTVSTAPVDMSGATRIWITVARGGGGEATVTDQATGCAAPCNTLTALVNSGSGPINRTLEVMSPTVGANYVVNVTTTGQFPSVCVVGYKGGGVPSFDAQNGASLAGSPGQPGSVTPAGNNELFIASLAFGAASTLSANSSFVLIDSVNFVGGTNYGTGIFAKVQTTGAAENPSLTWTGSGAAGATLGAIK